MSSSHRSRLTLELQADRVTLVGCASTKDGRLEERRAVLSLGPRPRVTLDGRPARWALWSGASPRVDARGDAVSTVARFVAQGLQREGGDVPARLAAHRNAVWAAAAQAGRAAATRAHAPSLQVALRFHPRLRWFVYQRLVQDPTGRLAQLAGAAPGAWSFAHALREQLGARGRWAVWRLLRGVREGRRLDPLLNEALEVWLEHALDAGVCPDPRGQHRAWARVAGAPAEERARIVVAQRLLVRRASGQVDSALLFLPPPLAFAPEDLPTDAGDLARWFEVMKGTAVTLEEPETWRRAEAVERCHFLSRNAVQLHRVLSRAPGGPSRLARLITVYASVRGERLHRRRPVDAFIARFVADREHEAMDRVLRRYVRQSPALSAAEHAAPLPPDLAFPLEHAARYELPGGGLIRALRTPAELYQEGEEMRHCVGDYVWDALEGRSSFWHASVDGRELTLELHSGRSGPSIYLLQERRGRSLSAGTTKKLVEWIRAVRAEWRGAFTA